MKTCPLRRDRVLSTYEFRRIFDNFFIFKKPFYQTVGGDFFSFLLKNLDRELFYQTPGDALT
jgi:hypothetical protein